MFDPSDNNLPKAKRRGRQAPIVEKPVKTSFTPNPPAATATPTVAHLPNGSTTTRMVPNGNRTPNGPSVPKKFTYHGNQNGTASHRTSNGSASFEHKDVKDIKPSIPSGNKLNAIGTGAVAVCAICITAIVDGKAIQCKDCTQKGTYSRC